MLSKGPGPMKTRDVSSDAGLTNGCLGASTSGFRVLRWTSRVSRDGAYLKPQDAEAVENDQEEHQGPQNPRLNRKRRCSGLGVYN